MNKSKNKDMNKLAVKCTVYLLTWFCILCGCSDNVKVSTDFESENQCAKCTKRALVIGLGEQEDLHWAKINGDKDVPFVKEMLENAGYRDLETLVNRQATKKGIVEAFDSLADRCQEGDIVYIHFSGHGQQVTDVNGDEQNDRLDESWIPYDAYLVYSENDKGEKHLIDDEINVLLTAINDKIGKQGKLLVVVDACHSGDSQRSDDMGETVRGVYDTFEIPIAQKGTAKKRESRWLTLSACKDFQLNQEIKDSQMGQVGRLTCTLYKLSKKGIVSMEKIEQFMDASKCRIKQTPDLSGEAISYTISDFF